MKVTREFLEKIRVRQSWSGNINKISKDVYTFTIYNFLPGTNPHRLDGHYSFAVNITNFKYVYWKDSNYGGLTYVRDNIDKILLPVHKSVKSEIEGIIASKLLGAYWDDGSVINGNGNLLFPKKTTEYDPYSKRSIICTWHDDQPNTPLGTLDGIELLAVEKLQL